MTVRPRIYVGLKRALVDWAAAALDRDASRQLECGPRDGPARAAAAVLQVGLEQPGAAWSTF